MGVRGYTKNYKLIKPEYDTDTWHDYEYDNLDTLDAVLSAIYASGDWQGFWQNNTNYRAGSIIIDRDTDTMYKVLQDHVTDETTFDEYFAAHPDYYRLWSPNNLAEDWAIKMDDEVENGEYSAKAHASSEGLVPTGSAKEWANQSQQARDDIFNNENFRTVSDNIDDVNTVGQNIDSVITNATNIDIIETTANNIDAVIDAKSNAEKSRIWATGSDPEVQELEEHEHSSRTYSNMAMAIANSPEDVPILESQLLATNVIKGEKGDKGDAWDGGEVNHPVTFKGDDNHPVTVEAMAGTTSSGIQLIDSLGAGETYFDQYNTGDSYGTKIRNKNNTTGQIVDLNLYQTNAGKSVLDLSEVNTILAPQLLDMIYPVGSYYLSEESTCPLSEWMDGCEWEIVGTTLVTGTSAAIAGNGLTLGLTDGTTNSGLVVRYDSSGGTRLAGNASSYGSSVGTTASNTGYTNNLMSLGITTDPEKSGIVANLPTIQVNIFRRVQ